MAASVQVLLDRLADGAVYTSVVSIAIGGGLAHFKPWLLPQEDTRKRVDLQRQRLIEGMATVTQRVFDKATTGDVPLRGDATHPDVLAEHATETFRILSVLQGLDRIHFRVKGCYTFLFATAATGVLATLVVLLAVSTRPWIGLASLVIIVAQLLTVFRLRALADALEDYEYTT